jgi:hypothetical protein
MLTEDPTAPVTNQDEDMPNQINVFNVQLTMYQGRLLTVGEYSQIYGEWERKKKEALAAQDVHAVEAVPQLKEVADWPMESGYHPEIPQVENRPTSAGYNPKIPEIGSVPPDILTQYPAFVIRELIDGYKTDEDAKSLYQRLERIDQWVNKQKEV